MNEDVLEIGKGDPTLRNFMGMVTKVNEAIKDEHGQGVKIHEDSGFCEMDVVRRNGKTENVKIKYNAVVPNQELFSVAQELVRAADEPFAARSVFAIDSSFAVGSQTVAYDVIAEEGEAKLVAVGETSGDIPEADASVGRRLQAVGKISSMIKITRDDIQLLQLRRDRGMGPLLDLMTEKLRVARKNVDRREDEIIWNGAKIAASTTKIQGYFDRFTTTFADASGNAPAFGFASDVATGAWAGATSDQIIADLAAGDGVNGGEGYINRNNSYSTNYLILPPRVLTQALGLRKTSQTDSTPLINWIKAAYQNMYNRDIQIISTNAIDGSINTPSKATILNSVACFSLIDSRQENFAIAEVEPLTVLPSKEDKEGTIEQVVTKKTGGLQSKHPSAAYIGRNI